EQVRGRPPVRWTPRPKEVADARRTAPDRLRSPFRCYWSAPARPPGGRSRNPWAEASGDPPRSHPAQAPPSEPAQRPTRDRGRRVPFLGALQAGRRRLPDPWELGGSELLPDLPDGRAGEPAAGLPHPHLG